MAKPSDEQQRALAGLLGTQARWVMSAHRHAGLVLERRLNVGPWTTLVLRKGGAVG